MKKKLLTLFTLVLSLSATGFAGEEEESDSTENVISQVDHGCKKCKR